MQRVSNGDYFKRYQTHRTRFMRCGPVKMDFRWPVEEFEEKHKQKLKEGWEDVEMVG